MLAEADPVAAEFLPLYAQGEAMGHGRAEMRGWPVPYAAAMLGAVGDDAEPVVRGSRQVQLPSDSSPRSGPGRSRRPRPPRARKRQETGKVFRGKDAR